MITTSLVIKSVVDIVEHTCDFNTTFFDRSNLIRHQKKASKYLDVFWMMRGVIGVKKNDEGGDGKSAYD